MTVPFIGPEDIEAHLAWADVTDALRAGHRRPRAAIADGLVRRGSDGLLTRSAWIDGLGAAVKTATVVPGNAADSLPTIHGRVTLYDDRTGIPDAILDFHLVTRWKTAGDSLLGAQFLARPDSRRILILGAGAVARTLVSAYSSHFRDATFRIWNRTPAGAVTLVAEAPTGLDIDVAGDLAGAVREADIICGATMAIRPVLRGAWLRPGQHLDLIGSYRPDMREVDDDAISRSSLFADSLETTLGHSGEFLIPLAAGIMSKTDIRGDLYDLVAGKTGRASPDEITLFKNGGGAHLDLMTARRILETWRRITSETQAPP
ncbi:MAG: ornithine cyclodeaminase [Paracoccaceae bacterium]|nr:ornithine cyclodeaminase [Paracoccaceae bacterium]MDE2912873.1 ornithine cyclodeaminase [Paracoccaceae bacterium]